MVSFYTTLHHYFYTAAATLHITEYLVNPRCPKCKGLMADFEACAALHHTCGAHICAWCLSTHDNKAACHAHVVDCPFNLNPGQLYPPSPHPVLWWSVMYEWARKRIRDYIKAHVHPALQQRVHDTCKKMHPSLGLLAWGVQDSGDGWRQSTEKRSARTPTFEENVTTLIMMGLANQARAVQVLEGLGNDLEAAIELLLGYYNIRSH